MHSFYQVLAYFGESGYSNLGESQKQLLKLVKIVGLKENLSTILC